MSEKLCLQSNDFKENILTSFSSLRGDNDFADVTLACEDGQQVEAHKVILAASSPFFQNLLNRNKHSHPLIYMRGVKSEVLLAIIDFLYFGETNIFQENLDSFLVIAEELHLKGLMGTTNDETMSKEKANKTTDVKKENPVKNKESGVLKSSGCADPNVKEQTMYLENYTFPGTIAMTSDFSVHLQDLDVKVNSMMEKTPGKNTHGQPLYRCTVCGKEAKNGNLKIHIEGNHLEGISIPCTLCRYNSRSRRGLVDHKIKYHGNET